MLGDDAYAGDAELPPLSSTRCGESTATSTSSRRTRGAAAEHILSEVLIKPGQIVPGNMYFTTTRLHQELAGGTFVDVIVDEAHDPTSGSRGRATSTSTSSTRSSSEHGAAGRLHLLRASVNMAGGQPVSMDNLREVYALLPPERDPGAVRRDARGRERATSSRSASPATRDDAVARHPARDDALRRRLHGLGQEGLPHQHRRLLAQGQRDAARAAQANLRVYEGAPRRRARRRDLAAMARGIEEMVDDRYIRARVEQVAQLAERLRAPASRSSSRPAATRSSSTSSASSRTSTRTCTRRSGWRPRSTSSRASRAMERGNVSKGRDPETGENYRPALELVRADDPAARLHGQAHARGRSLDRRCHGAGRGDRRPRDGVRARVPPVLPGEVPPAGTVMFVATGRGQTASRSAISCTRNRRRTSYRLTSRSYAIPVRYRTGWKTR